MIEEYANHEADSKQNFYFMLVSCMAYSSTLKMVTCSSEMSVDFHQTIHDISQKIELFKNDIRETNELGKITKLGLCKR
jgi:hypothetical protein